MGWVRDHTRALGVSEPLRRHRRTRAACRAARPEYCFLREHLPTHIAAGDVHLVGEFVECLRAFGARDADPLVQVGSRAVVVAPPDRIARSSRRHRGSIRRDNHPRAPSSSLHAPSKTLLESHTTLRRAPGGRTTLAAIDLVCARTCVCVCAQRGITFLLQAQGDDDRWDNESDAYTCYHATMVAVQVNMT